MMSITYAQVNNELYRKGAKIGDGGTADMAPYDLGHAEKALNYARYLERLIKSGVLNAADSRLATILRNVLNSAGSGK